MKKSKEVTEVMKNIKTIIELYTRSKKKKPILQGVKLIFEYSFIIEWIILSKRELDYIKDLVLDEK